MNLQKSVFNFQISSRLIPGYLRYPGFGDDNPPPLKYRRQSEPRILEMSASGWLSVIPHNPDRNPPGLKP